MTPPHDESPRLLEGSTGVIRDVFDGKIWSATPNVVTHNSDEGLVLCLRPGTRMIAPTTWITWLETGDVSARFQAIPNLVARQWDLGSWTWRDTVLLRHYVPGEYFNVSQFQDAHGRFGSWYVNFELPYQHTSIGIDTFDLLLDLVIEPDLSRYAWKDEDEYEQGRRLGLINDSLHQRVDEARQQVLALIESRGGPFAGDPSTWRHDPKLPLPELPADVISVPPSRWADTDR